MPRDPLQSKMREVYRQTRQYQLDQLLEAETRWKRKATIATNKLAEVRNEINKLAQEWARTTTSNEPGSDSDNVPAAP